MCQPIRCRVCGKTTWTGCGSHIEEVRRTVPAADCVRPRHPVQPRHPVHRGSTQVLTAGNTGQPLADATRVVGGCCVPSALARKPLARRRRCAYVGRHDLLSPTTVISRLAMPTARHFSPL